MGKTLVIYFSLEGNTEFAAKTIAETLKADVLKLELVKSISSTGFSRFFWGGKQVVMKEAPELRPFSQNPAAYDLIILGTPVWAGSYAPALRTFFKTTPLTGKRLALFCCYANNAGKTFDAMKAALPGNAFLGEKGFLNPAKQPEQVKNDIIAWAKSVFETAEKK